MLKPRQLDVPSMMGTWLASATRVQQRLTPHRIRLAWRRRIEYRPLIAAYLQSAAVPKLHLGAGKNILAGWLNTDYGFREKGIVFLDARRRFPFDDACFHYVFAEHMLEHLTYEEGQLCLAECRRVLFPGGRVRIATPSLDRLAALYGATGIEMEEAYLRWATERFLPEGTPALPGFVLNNFFYSWGHRFIYDPETLRLALETAGFSAVVHHPIGESTDQALSGIEHHADVTGDLANRFETIAYEGTAW